MSTQATGMKSVLRWAGLAGMIGVLMNILSFIAGLFSPPLFVAAPTGSSCGPACYVDAALPGFPGVKYAIVAENVFYFAAIILFVVFFLGLYRALGSSLAPGFFGAGMSLMGLAMEFIGALPSVAFAHLSEVYQTSGASDQSTIVFVSHAVQAIFNTTDTVGGILLVVGFLMFGLAMFQNPASFGKTLGISTILLSLAALAGISAFSIATDNPNDPFFVILLLILPLILGYKLYRLSKSA